VTLQTGSLVGSLRTGRSNIALALTIFVAIGLFGIATRRRQRWPRLLAILLCFTTLAAISGCNNSSTQIYNLTINAVGTGGQTHTITWAVTVLNVQ